MNDDDARPDDDATGAPEPATSEVVEHEPSGDPVPEDAVAAQLRDALGQLRGEADRIAELGTGQEQVEAAERFAEDAGRLDEQVGAAARAADADGHR